MNKSNITANDNIRRNQRNGKSPTAQSPYTTSQQEDYLPGLEPDADAGEPSAPHLYIPQPGWWMKRSPKQVMNAAGRPAGYRYRLMLGSKAIKTGVGADCRRTFSQQADFYNERNRKAVDTDTVSIPHDTHTFNEAKD